MKDPTVIFITCVIGCGNCARNAALCMKFKFRDVLFVLICMDLNEYCSLG